MKTDFAGLSRVAKTHRHTHATLRNNSPHLVLFAVLAMRSNEMIINKKELLYRANCRKSSSAQAEK